MIMNRKMLTLFLVILLFPLSVSGATLFSGNFDSWADWTQTQSTSTSYSCYSSCSLTESWTAWNVAQSQCGANITSDPGNNSLYVNAVAGYPSGELTCRSGKCLTKWQEACDAGDVFDDADANLGVDLGSEHAEVYLRWYIKFPTTFTLINDQSFKLWHMQHYNGGGANPWNYFERDTNNQPLVSGGIRRADTNYVDIYAEARGYPTYYTHGFMFWRLSTYTVAKAAGGLLDGEWHSIEIRHKANTAINTANGILEVWVDGTQLDIFTGYTANDINFTNGGTDLRGFRFFSIAGNNMKWTTACSDGTGDMVSDGCEQWYAIDDVVAADAYIGTADPEEDTTAPTIVSVNSNKANGSYRAGEVIDIDVTFSEVVTSTGNVTVTLETGDTDRTCTFTVTSGSTGTCNYTVQAGDTSADLQATISGTIADANSNAMSNFTPTTNLAANKAIVIDTAAPSVDSFTIPSTAGSLTVSISAMTCTGQSHFTVNESAEAPAHDAAGWVASAPATYTFSGTGEKTLYAWCKDTAGNVSTSLNDSVTVTSGINKAPFVIQ